MISLDQVLLLQEKVETAVEKIGKLTGENTQLKSENDALRSKCAELTKALSEKTELVSTLEQQQGQIEQGILSALNRLDTVENAVLNGAGSNTSTSAPAAEVEKKNELSEDETVPASEQKPEVIEQVAQSATTQTAVPAAEQQQSTSAPQTVSATPVQPAPNGSLHTEAKPLAESKIKSNEQLEIY